MIGSAYVKTIKLENIRAFKNLDINLTSSTGQRMTSVIIGRNGTCKTTLLRCIAMGLCHGSDTPALLAEFGGRLVSEDAETGTITFTMADHSGRKIGETQLVIENKKGRDILSNRKTSVPIENFFVCGYGPNRGNTGASMWRDYRVLDSVAPLFDYTRDLVHIELMLRRLEDYMGSSRYNRAKKGIKRVLGLGEEHSIRYAKGGGVSVSGPGIGNDIPLEAWADGYRMTFNWLVDLYGWAMHADTVTESGGIRGILLIDEVDQNLHPAMQSALLSELRDALPEVQVFATTHSPLTALGTSAENVLSFHRKDRWVEVVPVPSTSGYSADDALLEETLFGTDPYPRHTRRKLDRHHELAAAPMVTRSAGQDAEMKRLAKELNPEELPSFRGADDNVLKKLDHIADLLKKKKGA